MAIREREVIVIGEKVYYMGEHVANLNDLNMSKARFEFEDFLKSMSKRCSYEG